MKPLFFNSGSFALGLGLVLGGYRGEGPTSRPASRKSGFRCLWGGGGGSLKRNLTRGLLFLKKVSRNVLVKRIETWEHFCKLAENTVSVRDAAVVAS